MAVTQHSDLLDIPIFCAASFLEKPMTLYFPLSSLSRQPLLLAFAGAGMVLHAPRASGKRS